MALSKTDLVKEVSEQVDLSQNKTSDVLNAFLQSIQEELSRKGSVTLPGFGTFKTSERAARQGRNPQTGQTIEIAASTVPAFKAGATLKQAVKS